jgi:ribosomal protein S18 acetylase RimI-like enzyme
MSRPNHDDERTGPQIDSRTGLITRQRRRWRTLLLMREWTLAGRSRLGPDDRRRIEHLRDVCESAEPLDLKLELDEADRSGQPIHFLAEADGEVIGYAAITAEVNAEACGMVHTAFRRRGVATALLGEVRAAAGRRGRESFLVICEDSAPIALAWMRRLGATAAAAERRMTLRLPSGSARAGGAGRRTETKIGLRPPGPADRAALIGLLEDGFSESAQQVVDRLGAATDGESLVAVDEGVVVGTLRLTTTSKRSMIYGFVIDRTRRGRGLGTRMLDAALARMSASGVTEVGLEVDPENAPAVRLYQAFGFEAVTTYRYMRLRSAVN